jgi:phosphonate transport system substrate-binding protein
LLAVILLVAATAFGCRYRAEDEIEVRLDSVSDAVIDPTFPAPTGSVDAPVRFAYTSVLSPERSTLTFARLGAYLAAKLERPVEIVRRRTYTEINELLRTGSADAGLICTGAFAAGQDGLGFEAIAIPVIGGKETYRSFVITRRDRGLTSFGDLEGTVFAFTDPLSNTGFRYVVAKLHEAGLHPQSFFSRFLFTYSHDNSIEAVLDGIADAGSVDSLVWDELVRRDPTLEDHLVIIDQSEDFPINPVAVGPGIQLELRARLTSAFLAMHGDPAGREVLFELGTDKFVQPTAGTLAGYEAIARSWRDLSSISLITGTGAR